MTRRPDAAILLRRYRRSIAKRWTCANPTGRPPYGVQHASWYLKRAPDDQADGRSCGERANLLEAATAQHDPLASLPLSSHLPVALGFGLGLLAHTALRAVLIGSRKCHVPMARSKELRWNNTSFASGYL